MRNNRACRPRDTVDASRTGEGFKILLAVTSCSMALDAQVRLWSLLQYH